MSSRKNTVNPYLPEKVILIERHDFTENCTLYIFEKEEPFHFEPGQFVSLTVPGAGEAPFSICSAPSEDGKFELCIKKMGRVTEYLHRTGNPGMTFGIRGPFGRGFPLKEMEGSDLLFVGGGIGYAPLRSVMLAALSKREKFGNIHFLYGVNSPWEMIFKEEVETLSRNGLVNFCVSTVEGSFEGSPFSWGRGFVTDFISSVDIDPERTYAMLVGPPVMYRTAVEKLFARGVKEENIFLSLERRMECGIGKCGHCAIGYRYTCLDGPVFPYYEAITLHEAI